MLHRNSHRIYTKTSILSDTRFCGVTKTMYSVPMRRSVILRRMWSELAAHPTLTLVNLTAWNGDLSGERRSDRACVLAEALKTTNNKALGSIIVPPGEVDEQLFNDSVQPRLDLNIFCRHMKELS
jgi:hypothetical protein